MIITSALPVPKLRQAAAIAMMVKHVQTATKAKITNQAQ